MASNTHDNPIGPDHQLPAPRQHNLGIAILIGIVILLIAGGVVFVVIRHRAAAPTAGGGRHGMGGPVSITMATARTGDIGVYVEAIGTVTPVYTTTITSQVTGPITHVHFKEGQIVNIGDHLIDIDPRPYEATLQQAQGTLQKDESLLAQAQMDLERYKAAWARNAIPKQTLDDQEKLVDQDAGTVENDKGTVRYDTIQLGYCTITAPIAGRVGLRLLDPGNVVQANSTTPLAVITQLSPITVVFTIPEDNIDQVVSHMTASEPMKVFAYDRTAQTILATGKLLTLDNQIDTTTGTVKGRAEFVNDKNTLFPNQFVNTRLLVNTLKDVTLIPSAAIQHNEQESFVYVINEDETNKQHGTATMQDVTPGVSDNNTTEVKGLKPGTIVAESGFERLTDKAQIVIVPSGGGGGASTRPTSQPGHSGHHHHSDNGEPSTTQSSEESAP